MINLEYSEAIVEVLGILESLEDEEKSKIPNEIMEFFYENKSDTYNPELDYYDEVENLNLKKKTKEILAGLYIDYLSTEEQKKEFTKKLRENEVKYQNELKEKYNSDDIFKNKKAKTKIENKSLIIVKKENFFDKIIRKIKKIFKF